MIADLPLLEYDPTLKAIIEPHGARTSEPAPARCVLFFFLDVIAGLKKAGRLRRIAVGCQVVEMEAAAFFAVAKFRAVVFGQLVYDGDLVVPEGWEHRDWINRNPERELLFWLAVESVLRT